MAFVLKVLKFLFQKKEVKGASKLEVFLAVSVASLLGLAVGCGIGFFLAKSPKFAKKSSRKEIEVPEQENKILSKEDYE